MLDEEEQKTKDDQELATLNEQEEKVTSAEVGTEVSEPGTSEEATKIETQPLDKETAGDVAEDESKDLESLDETPLEEEEVAETIESVTEGGSDVSQSDTEPTSEAAVDVEGNDNLQEDEDEEKPDPNQTLAGSINENLKWYVIHTYSGYEEKAKKALVQRCKEKKFEEKVGTIHIPQTQKEITTKTGKKKIVFRTSFPGYMMAQLDLTDQLMVLVKDTPKITGFVGDNRYPKPLSDKEVRAMLDTAESEAELGATAAKPEIQFSKGDAVKVVDGPFSNFDGIVEEVRPEKARVRVLVSIFGRETPVDLEFAQIEQV